jgi:tetratricopeptide (TPR) repeat protein
MSGLFLLGQRAKGRKPVTLADLERRALELVKRGDFGEEASRVNAAIAEQAPRDVSAWTRLGRCYLEQRNWDDAVLALRAALAVNPSHTIATNLLNEVRKQRALTPTAAQRSTTGFGAREFAMLAALSASEACAALQPRIDMLLDALNSTDTAARIVSVRQSQAESGTKLFHANSHSARATGHVSVSHRGGRFEPQFNLGWLSSPPFPASCVRMGLGFNFTAVRRESDEVAGLERALAFFERFQQTLEKSWKRELARWMAANGGFIQYADRPPAVDVLPDQAVEWLLNCRNAAALEWIFVGRWLFLGNPDDARILGDRARLAKAADDTFRTLYPLWLGAYRA